jgi:hypothetical protein
MQDRRAILVLQPDEAIKEECREFVLGQISIFSKQTHQSPAHNLFLQNGFLPFGVLRSTRQLLLPRLRLDQMEETRCDLWVDEITGSQDQRPACQGAEVVVSASGGDSWRSFIGSQKNLRRLDVHLKSRLVK